MTTISHSNRSDSLTWPLLGVAAVVMLLLPCAACSDKTTAGTGNESDAVADAELPPLDATDGDSAADVDDAADATPDAADAAPDSVDAGSDVDGGFEPMGGCYNCHGTIENGNPAPPIGTGGEIATSQLAVGAHQQHLANSAWHRTVQCEDCHKVPTQAKHKNGVIDFAWSGVATAMASAPAFDEGTATCSGAYCHGGTLFDAATVKTKPVWTQVDGTFSSCGASCHMTPPGGPHPQNSNCAECHDAVIASFDPATQNATWANPALHVNGIVESSGYHGLSGWVSPKVAPGTGQANPNHHGFGYFLANHGKDDKGTDCTECHGADFAGGIVGVSCNNSTINCHGANPAGGTGGDWHACNFCHGGASQDNPPAGVAAETTSQTLAVGRHLAHLSASATHVAFACTNCHVVPPAGDLGHTQQYAPSADLTTAGHHGDVTFPPAPTDVNSTGGMIWDVNAVTGAPPSARGACNGACHSDGRGGVPNVTPRWAGGTWSAGSCGNCHDAMPMTGHHADHLSSENNVACTTCHPGATSASHVNGLRDVTASMSGAPYSGSIAATRPKTGGCSTSVQCNGTCHGQAHSPECW